MYMGLILWAVGISAYVVLIIIIWAVIAGGARAKEIERPREARPTTPKEEVSMGNGSEGIPEFPKEEKEAV